MPRAEGAVLDQSALCTWRWWNKTQEAATATVPFTRPPAQRERKYSSSAFRNTVIICLMIVHQSPDSKNDETYSGHLRLRLVTAVCLLAWRCWNSPGGYKLTEEAATQLLSLDQFSLDFTLPAP